MGKHKGQGNPNWVKGGPSPNPRGRELGSKNQETQRIRDFLQAVMEDNLEGFKDDLKRMQPFQRWQTLARLSDKFLPNLSNVIVDAEIKGDLKVNFNISEEEE